MTKLEAKEILEKWFENEFINKGKIRLPIFDVVVCNEQRAGAVNEYTLYFLMRLAASE